VPAARPAAPPQAIVFDLDGTLVDSLADIAAALAGALADHRRPPPTTAEVRSWIGDGARSLVARALAHADGAPPPPSQLDAVLASFGARYAATPVGATRPYDGIAAALDALAADGRRLAILSNKPHPLTTEVAARLLAGWRFEVVRGARPGHPLKPDPAAALEVAAALGVPPAACAMVGDSEVDVEVGRAAGMFTVAVSWGYRRREALADAAPDALVDTPGALPALLGGGR
jgi:phosphoglycolate phosphatase